MSRTPKHTTPPVSCTLCVPCLHVANPFYSSWLTGLSIRPPPLSLSPSAAHRTAQGGLTTGWWYEGSGLIRSARLVATSAEAAIEPFGLSSPSFFQGDATPHTAGKTSAGLFAGSAVMSPTATLVGTGIDGAGIKVNFDLVDATGATVASARFSPVAGVAEAELTVAPLVELWSVPRPYLYELEVTVIGVDGEVLDTTSVATGIRNLNWDAELGLKVNEERVKMRGACNHESFTGVCPVSRQISYAPPRPPTHPTLCGSIVDHLSLIGGCGSGAGVFPGGFTHTRPPYARWARRCPTGSTCSGCNSSAVSV